MSDTASTASQPTRAGLTLKGLCRPRTSVFDRQRADTVVDITDFVEGRVDADRFFDENHVTEGMATLLKQVFGRLCGPGPQGVFRLKQAMGGGKTHNMVATGLLARNPTLRRKVLTDLGQPVDTRDVQVAAFTGRETDLQDYLWVHLAKQLGREDLFKAGHSEVPGQSTWASVIGDRPTLILLDELPPFFEVMAAKRVGPTQTEADRLAAALGNLMTAVLSDKLKNCCVIISDLTGSWAGGSALIDRALANANNEAMRGAMDITPVRMDGSELYAILRARLFAELPGQTDISKVAQAYAASYRTAVQQSAMPQAFERWGAEIANTYPFHPGLQELFARFRENEGFQQTRETLRLGRRMVERLWDPSGGADKQLLIHPHDVDFNDPDTENVLDRINQSLQNARTRDVARNGHAISEVLSQVDGQEAAHDAAKLLFFSSLAISTNALHGLTPEEVAAYLCAPGRDVARIGTGLLTRLEDDGWYLHRRTDGRFFYRNVKNVSSAIKDRAQTMTTDARKKEVQNELKRLFDPGGRTGAGRQSYQELLIFPTIEDIQKAMSPDKVLLVISQPHGNGLSPELKSLWDGETFKNRLMFLCGTAAFTSLLDNVAYMKAAADQVKEFQDQKMLDTSPEMQQSLTASERFSLQFSSSLREAFTILHYPDLEGKLYPQPLKLEFAGNDFSGERAILATLRTEKKFDDDCQSDRLRLEFEQHIFRSKEAQWRGLMDECARNAEWYFLPPGGHETMKTAAILADLWRDEGGGYIKKGPFPLDPTEIVLHLRGEQDHAGKVTLEVSAKRGDRVYYEFGTAVPTTSSLAVENGQLATDEMRVSFLAVDSTGKHPTGAVRIWENTVTLRYERKYRDGAHRVTLQSAPVRGTTIRYSTTATNPRTGGIYTDEIEVPVGTKLVRAIAENSGIWSDERTIEIPAEATRDDDIKIDPLRPASYRGKLACTDRRRTYEAIAILKRHGATLGGLHINVSKAGSATEFAELNLGDELPRSMDEVESLITSLLPLLPTDPPPDLTMYATRLSFPTGEALVEAAKELNMKINPDAVRQ